MISRLLHRAAVAASLCALSLQPAAAQSTIGVSMDYMGYSFDPGLGADAAQLMMIPVAVRIQAGSAFAFDVYSAWAEGKVQRDNTEFTLRGPVDTQVKMTYQITPWALFSLGAALPTGAAQHSSEEAVVASVLSADIFGFREASFGSGSGLTSSLATAARIGGWGVGVAGAYSVRGEFEPSSEDDLRYQPGNETRVRVGLDRNIGSSTFTAGATFQTYTQDQADGFNLFQAGERLRFDAAYQFRANNRVWAIYGAHLTRDNGDLTLSIVDNAGAIVGDTAFVTAKQDLTVVGIIGEIGVGGGFRFRPSIDLRIQDRLESDGRDEGSGWMLSAGGDFPMRLFGSTDFFPKARVLYGSILDPAGAGISVLGLEVTGTLRWGF